MNSWSWLSRVGPTSCFDPLVTTFSARYWEKKSLWDSYLTDISFTLLSFNVYFIDQIYILTTKWHYFIMTLWYAYIHTVITLYRIMCRISGTWHDSLPVNITVEEFCLRRKNKKSCAWLLKYCASHCWTIVPVTVE